METYAAMLSALCAAMVVWLIWPSSQPRYAISQSSTAQHLLMRLSSLVDSVDAIRFLDRICFWPDFVRAAQLWLERRGMFFVQNSVVRLLFVAVILVSLLAAVTSLSPFVFVVVLVSACLWIQFKNEQLSRQRAQQVQEDMPRLLRSLAHAISSGQTLMQAINYVANQEQGPAREAFRRASMRLSCGASLAEALEELNDSLELSSTRMLVDALMISQRTGSPLQAMLTRSAQLVEQQSEFEQILVVKTAQVRLSVRIVVALPLIMLLLLSLLSSDFRSGLMSATGLVCVSVAAFLDICGLVAIRAMVRGVFS